MLRKRVGERQCRCHGDTAALPQKWWLRAGGIADQRDTTGCPAFQPHGFEPVAFSISRDAVHDPFEMRKGSGPGCPVERATSRRIPANGGQLYVNQVARARRIEQPAGSVPMLADP